MRAYPIALTLLILAGCAPPDPSVVMLAPASFDTPYVPRCKRLSAISPNMEPPENTTELYPDQLIDIGLSNNPLTRQSWHLARAAGYDLGAAKSALYLTFEGSETITAPATHGGPGGTAIATGGTSDAILAVGPRGRGTGNIPFVTSVISVNYLLLDFGGRCAEIRAAQQALLTADWTHNRVMQTVVLNVLNAYYNYNYALGIVKAREADLKDSQAGLDAAQQQFEAGVITKLDVLQAQSNTVNVKLQLETARGQVKTTRGQLATNLGWPADIELSVAPLPKELPLDAISSDLHELVEQAKIDRPDLAASYANYRRLQAEVIVAESAGLPTITLDGLAQRNDFINHSFFNNSSQNISITLNVPIFAGWLYENQTASARENAEAAYADWKNRENGVMLDVVTNYTNYNVAVENVGSSEDYLNFATETYEAALAQYKGGVGSYLDVLTAQLTLSQARTQYIAARTQLLTSLAGVAYAVGQL